jgi:hypothetical protein
MKYRWEFHKVTVARALIRRRLMDIHLEQRRAESKRAALIEGERKWLGGLHKELKYHDWEASWMRKPSKKEYHDWDARVGRPSKKRRPRGVTR